jgi:hypothetical protein
VAQLLVRSVQPAAMAAGPAPDEAAGDSDDRT